MNKLNRTTNIIIEIHEDVSERFIHKKIYIYYLEN